MCVILLVLKKEKKTALDDFIVNNIVNFSRYHRDGSALLAIGKDNKKENTPVFLLRGINYKMPEIIRAVRNNDFINLHFRQATTGAKTIENCHLWQNGNWFFSHNGTIGDLGNDKICDSKVFFDLLFFNKLIKGDKLKFNKIQKYIYNSQFTGRCVLYNQKLNRAYLFGNFKVYSINRNYLAICSSQLENNSTADVFGLKFEVENGDEKIELLAGEIEGVVMIDYNKNKIQKLADEYREPVYWEHRYGSGLVRSEQKKAVKKGVADEKISVGGQLGYNWNDEDCDNPRDVLSGKRLSEMTNEEITAYYGEQDGIKY